MKTILFSVLFAFALTLSTAHATDDKEKVVKIKTSAICGMCKSRLERNLGLSKGVKEANLDLKTKVMTVTYNPSKTDEAAIKATIVKTGYDANDLVADQKAHDKLPKCCQKTAAPHVD